MTVSSQTSNETFYGNGVTTVWDIPFRFFKNSDVFVYLIDPVTDTTTPLVIGTDYTLSGEGVPEKFGTAPGKITTTVAVANGKRLYIERRMRYEQLVDIINQGEFFPETHEDVFDTLTMLIQQVDATSRGAVRVAVGDPEPQRLPPVAARANRLMGFDSDGNPIPVSPVDGSSAGLALDLANSADSTKGSAMIGYNRGVTGSVGRPLSEKVSGAIDVKDFGAKGDGVTDDWAAINNAIAYARSFASVSVGPAFMVPPIWFPHGTYAVSKPFLCDEAFKFDGDNARILAKPGYTGISIPLAAGGTETSTQMFIFLKGKKGSQPSVTDVVRFGAQLGYGLIVDCQFIAKGPYFERMPYSRVNCQVQMSAGDGITFGNAMWGTSIDDVVIENATAHGLHFLTNSAFNGCSAKNIRIWGEFLTSQSGMTFDLNSECNGLCVSGSFIEKVDFGVIISGGNGPITFVGVDFEQCTNRVLLVAGSASPRIGPINLQNCYLHSIGLAKIYTDNAIVNVDGCKLSNVNLTQDFETDLFGRGLINVGPSNIYMNGGTVSIATGSSVSVQQVETVTRNFWQYLPHKTNSTVPVLNFKNYQYKDAPSLQSSGFIFSSNYAGGPTGQYVSQSDWWISEYQHISAPGVLTRTVGVRLANLSGQNSFQPMTNNATSCGAAGASWSGGSTQVAFTVVSDERVKAELQSLSEAEQRVAAKCKPLIFKFKLKSQIEREGSGARWHFGTSAQKVMEAFRSEGLDPGDYEIIEHQQWEAAPNTVGTDGEVIQGREAGDVYAVNYEQLLAFIISSI